jgi:hypothetical protein
VDIFMGSAQIRYAPNIVIDQVSAPKGTLAQIVIEILVMVVVIVMNPFWLFVGVLKSGAFVGYGRLDGFALRDLFAWTVNNY